MAASKPVPTITYQPMQLLEARRLDRHAPWRWLRQGWNTFMRMPAPAFLFGALFAVAGAAISWAAISQPQLVFAFWSGFLLIGPILAMVLYRMAKREQQGLLPDAGSCWRMLTAKPGTTLLFALLLALVMIAWLRVSTLIAALYAGGVGGSSFITQLGSVEGLGFVAIQLAVGGVFALAMFGLSVWSLPMMVDGRTDPVTAIASSVRAVATQPLVMLSWGVLVAALTLLGMATAFFGFAVIFPVLGFATWHAYREIFA